MTIPIEADSESVIGIAACTYCNKRFRVKQKYADFVGKAIACPKCNRSFVLELQTPSLLEQAAINAAAEASATAGCANSETSSEMSSDGVATASRNRRTREQIRDEHRNRIRDEVPRYIRRLESIASAESSSEEQVRIWCIDLIKATLGYKDDEIDTELQALGQRIDIAIKIDGKVVVVIECKNIRSNLPKSVRDQAVIYAANKSADWAVITNGKVWKLYRVVPVRGHDPNVIELFDIAFCDDDGLSESDIESLYLLTKRSISNGDTEKAFHLNQALRDERIIGAIRNEKVVKVLRGILCDSYKNENEVRVNFTTEELIERLDAMFLPTEF